MRFSWKEKWFSVSATLGFLLALQFPVLAWGDSTALAEGLQQKLIAARLMLASGQAHVAYAMLAPHEAEGAGDVEFDYLLGTAAVDSGYADDAIFILLRVINQAPRHGGAKIELGRAYFADGDYEASREQFMQVLEQNPPEAAKTLSEQYLVAIAERLEVRLQSFVPYVEVRVGYDTNANSATDEAQPFRGDTGVPAAFQGITLNAESIETASPLMSAIAGADYSNQFRPRWFMRAGGLFAARVNTNAHFVDTQAYQAYSRLEWRIGRDFVGIGADIGRGYVGSQLNTDTAGLSLFAGKSYGPRWAATAQLRPSSTRYAESQAAKDSDDLSVLTTLSRNWAGPKRFVLSASLIAQRVNAKTAINSKDVGGLQLVSSWQPFAATRVSLSYAYLLADYDAQLFGPEQREDKRHIVGAEWVRYSFRDPNLKWLINLDAHVTDSTLALYDTQGLKLSAGVRYDFR